MDKQRNHLNSHHFFQVFYLDNSYIKDKVNDSSISISYKKIDDSLDIKITKKVNLITPFSSLFFDNPFVIKTERMILYE